MRRVTTFFHATVLAVVILASAGFTTTIRPSKPTHLFYTPTGYLNNEYDLVISLHEVSYTLPQNLQIHMSLVDNIGRNCLGVRYSLMDNMNIGAGIAYSLTTFKNNSGFGGHGIKQYDDSRFGLFLTYGFIHTQKFNAAVTPHTQIGKHISMGADLGFMNLMNETFSLIGEIGSSMDLSETVLYLNLVGGVRIHPAKIPFLSFDLGVDFSENPIQEFVKHPMPYIDIVFTMKTN